MVVTGEKERLNDTRIVLKESEFGVFEKKIFRKKGIPANKYKSKVFFFTPPRAVDVFDKLNYTRPHFPPILDFCLAFLSMLEPLKRAMA